MSAIFIWKPDPPLPFPDGREGQYCYKQKEFAEHGMWLIAFLHDQSTVIAFEHELVKVKK